MQRVARVENVLEQRRDLATHGDCGDGEENEHRTERERLTHFIRVFEIEREKDQVETAEHHEPEPEKSGVRLHARQIRHIDPRALDRDERHAQNDLRQLQYHAEEHARGGDFALFDGQNAGKMQIFVFAPRQADEERRKPRKEKHDFIRIVGNKHHRRKKHQVHRAPQHQASAL